MSRKIEFQDDFTPSDIKSILESLKINKILQELHKNLKNRHLLRLAAGGISAFRYWFSGKIFLRPYISKNPQFQVPPVSLIFLMIPANPDNTFLQE